MWVLGLTGGIGSGKTAATRCFAQLGVPVTDADQLARVVVEPGRPALGQIVAHFGDAALAQDGTLNRAWLREQVFACPAQRQWLEGLLHPLIGEEINSHLQAVDSAYAILASPLLLETDQRRRVQRILVIDVDEATQVARTVARDDSSAQQVKEIMAAQMPRQQRLAAADDVITNTGSLQQLQQQVEELHQQYLHLAAAADAGGDL